MDDNKKEKISISRMFLHPQYQLLEYFNKRLQYRGPNLLVLEDFQIYPTQESCNRIAACNVIDLHYQTYSSNIHQQVFRRYQKQSFWFDSQISILMNQMIRVFDLLKVNSDLQVTKIGLQMFYFDSQTKDIAFNDFNYDLNFEKNLQIGQNLAEGKLNDSSNQLLFSFSCALFSLATLIDQTKVKQFLIEGKSYKKALLTLIKISYNKNVSSIFQQINEGCALKQLIELIQSLTSSSSEEEDYFIKDNSTYDFYEFSKRHRKVNEGQEANLGDIIIQETEHILFNNLKVDKDDSILENQYLDDHKFENSNISIEFQQQIEQGTTQSVQNRQGLESEKLSILEKGNSISHDLTITAHNTQNQLFQTSQTILIQRKSLSDTQNQIVFSFGKIPSAPFKKIKACLRSGSVNDGEQQFHDSNPEKSSQFSRKMSFEQSSSNNYEQYLLKPELVTLQEKDTNIMNDPKSSSPSSNREQLLSKFNIQFQNLQAPSILQNYTPEISKHTSIKAQKINIFSANDQENQINQNMLYGDKNYTFVKIGAKDRESRQFTSQTTKHDENQRFNFDKNLLINNLKSPSIDDNYIINPSTDHTNHNFNISNNNSASLSNSIQLNSFSIPNDLKNTNFSNFIDSSIFGVKENFENFVREKGQEFQEFKPYQQQHNTNQLKPLQPQLFMQSDAVNDIETRQFSLDMCNYPTPLCFHSKDKQRQSLETKNDHVDDLLNQQSLIVLSAIEVEKEANTEDSINFKQSQSGFNEILEYSSFRTNQGTGLQGQMSINDYTVTCPKSLSALLTNHLGKVQQNTLKCDLSTNQSSHFISIENYTEGTEENQSISNKMQTMLVKNKMFPI